MSKRIERIETARTPDMQLKNTQSYPMCVYAGRDFTEYRRSDGRTYIEHHKAIRRNKF